MAPPAAATTAARPGIRGGPSRAGRASSRRPPARPRRGRPSGAPTRPGSPWSRPSCTAGPATRGAPRLGSRGARRASHPARLPAGRRPRSRGAEARAPTRSAETSGLGRLGGPVSRGGSRGGRLVARRRPRPPTSSLGPPATAPSCRPPPERRRPLSWAPRPLARRPPASAPPPPVGAVRGLWATCTATPDPTLSASSSPAPPPGHSEPPKGSTARSLRVTRRLRRGSARAREPPTLCPPADDSGPVPPGAPAGFPLRPHTASSVPIQGSTWDFVTFLSLKRRL